ncbi:hypothetical protein MKW98_021573 [Papaver atlanticum]|uniref:Uncharacterized protein n=1 Tax=Papaver atlanticum TaxID=357466 RepID=A0AAD4T9J5_9MAGN|nr:hypothetical protein MKW98_021573 [Papaver atlanticum]
MSYFSVLLFVLVLCNKPLNSIADDAISTGDTLRASQTITSKYGRFRMGFFAPGKSQNYYISIWYAQVSETTIVWVANRDKPITASELSNSELKLLENGNLVLYNPSRTSIWSTNSASSTSNTTEAVLGDNGNLVLRDKSKPSVVIWQSFDFPTDTWLPGAKIGINKKTRETKLLTSWRNQEDPAKGIFSLDIDPTGINQYIIKWNKSEAYWTSGEWNEQTKTFSLVPEMRFNYIYNFSYISNEDESYFNYTIYNNSILSRFVMDVSGQMKQFTWSNTTQKWNMFASEPKQLCDVYGICGAFGICNQDTSKCECLSGFIERFPSDWNLRDSTGGCHRDAYLQCGSNNVFSPIPTSKLPDYSQSGHVNSAEKCKSACQSTCSCNAYAFGNTGCQLWQEDMLNTKQKSDQSDDRPGNLYLKLAEGK